MHGQTILIAPEASSSGLSISLVLYTHTYIVYIYLGTRGERGIENAHVPSCVYRTARARSPA